ncbi:DUF6198 family protein [Trueperella sp.]|uniref:YczE/YyaS/YitT family protein n=1 Tax=Trueperella sp. TaxID=2699835 RepID=UPI0022EAF149|nr:DUF6198 family protein [Trueperella sp.]
MITERPLWQRWMWFLIGVAMGALGIAVVTKSALGTTPISALPLVFSYRFAPTFGVFTFVMNMAFILVQAAIYRKEWRAFQWLQILINFLFSAFIDLWMVALTRLEPEHLAWRCVLLALGCVILGLGISIQVAPGILTVPGEGIVKAVGWRTKIRFGTVKIVFDTTLVVLAGISSLVFFGHLAGIGVGTVVSMFAVGLVVNWCNGHIGWLKTLGA